MGEAQTPHFYDFGIFEPVAKPQNQLFLFLETPGHRKQNKENSNIVQNIVFINIGILNFSIFRKDGHREMMKIRLKNFNNLVYGINIFLKT